MSKDTCDVCGKKATSWTRDLDVREDSVEIITAYAWCKKHAKVLEEE
jgi:hypothetical protein